ncbi:MAG: nicotinamide mononucleotide transporter [Gammaproteobacteria bacterium]|nr:nicotinamide mononucleotide transporter [Gammaproteobacteria bacterium]
MADVLTYSELAWQQTSAWEMIAVLFAIIYLLLAIAESIWCWPAALISTCIYVFLFFDVNLYMESALQIFYIGMAIYGWIIWRHHNDSQDDLHISVWSLKQHLLAFILIAFLVVITAVTLENNTDAAYPWLDSFTTWGAVITTWMVARKILENWIYWLFIDAVSIYLYIQRDLYLTALLFAIYIILCFLGFHQWHKTYKLQLNENKR